MRGDLQMVLNVSAGTCAAMFEPMLQSGVMGGLVGCGLSVEKEVKTRPKSRSGGNADGRR